VGLAAQKQYLSLYVNAAEDGEYLIKRYADRLGKVKAGSANVTFRHLADVELEVLLEMVARARAVMTG
jgi:polyhydroxyalkanoate synthesis regulator protein